MLKRNQRVYEKLTEALKECKITQIDHLDQDELASTYQSWDYLHYCVKECLRIDLPVIGSAFYKCQEDVSICNVPIPKAELMVASIIHSHYNPEKYQESFE